MDARVIFASLILLAACDEPLAPVDEPGGDAGPARLAGIWTLTDSSGATNEFSFKSDGSYQNDLYVTVNGTSLVQREAGTYGINGSLLTTNPTVTSCPSTGAVALGFELSNNGVLVLTNGALVFTFAPIQASKISGALQTGCFVNGQFVPAQLQTVR